MQRATQASGTDIDVRTPVFPADEAEPLGVDAEKTRCKLETFRWAEPVVAQPDDGAFPFELEEQASESPIIAFGHFQCPAQLTRFERAPRFTSDKIQNAVAGYGHGVNPSRSR